MLNEQKSLHECRFSLTESYDYKITKTKIYTTYLVDFDKHLHDIIFHFV